LKLTCDEPLSNVAFNFNLRRYNKERAFNTVLKMNQLDKDEQAVSAAGPSH